MGAGIATRILVGSGAMGMNTLTSLVLDPYERSARLAPAMIAMLPLLLMATTVQIFSKSVTTQLLAVFGACGVIFLLSNIARMLGKAKESNLYESWGGVPTTQLLRHRDNQIDRITKQRYHSFLERKTKTVFPSIKKEQEDPGHADEHYSAGVKWLLGKTRDKKLFPLLAKENISYGFHRNGYGMRWVGSLCVAIALGFWLNANKLLTIDTEKLVTFPYHDLEPVQLAILVIYLSLAALWAFYFTRSRVRQSGFAYADMLLRSCDALR